jgi:hypothetical protein
MHFFTCSPNVAGQSASILLPNLAQPDLTLGNIDALYEWAERDDPGYRVCIFVTSWLATEVGLRGWAAPSVPMLPREGERPETRIVVIPTTMVSVVYEHEDETGLVDLLWIGSEDLGS